jgi:hypothetical protein
MNLDIPNAAVVIGCASRTSLAAGLFSEQSLRAPEIAGQTSCFKFLVQPRITDREVCRLIIKSSRRIRTQIWTRTAKN